MAEREDISQIIEVAVDKTSYDGKGLPWDCLALVALSTCNTPSPLSDLYEQSILKASTFSPPLARNTIYARFNDALIKTLAIIGLPKTVNAFFALIPAVRDSDLEGLRARDFANTEESKARLHLYGGTTHAGDFEEMVEIGRRYSPDLAHVAFHTSMEHILSDYAVHDGVATMALLITVLICQDCPLQASWHMKGFLRQGGKVELLQEIVDFSLRVAKVCDVRLKGNVPDVQVVLEEVEAAKYGGK